MAVYAGMPGGLSMDELSARMAAQSSVRLDKAQVRDAVKAAAERSHNYWKYSKA